MKSILAILIVALPMLLFCGCNDLTNRPTLLVFTSAHCAPCQQEKPAVDAVRRSGYCTVKVIDAETDGAIFDQYGVDRMPHYIMFVGKNCVWQGDTIMPVYHKACGR